MRVGSSPPCKNDSVSPISTLHHKFQNVGLASPENHIAAIAHVFFLLPGHVSKIIACVTCDIYPLQEPNDYSIFNLEQWLYTLPLKFVM